MNCLETKDLSYRFTADQLILDKINLQVPSGSIYGFLGPNGAGKTTTLRLILGLLKKQEGNIQIFGKSLEKDRISILRNIGSMIEGMRDYRKIHINGKPIMTLQTFKDFEKDIPAKILCREHKSFMVAIDKIDSIEKNEILIGEKRIPISDTYRQAFYEILRSKD